MLWRVAIVLGGVCRLGLFTLIRYPRSEGFRKVPTIEFIYGRHRLLIEQIFPLLNRKPQFPRSQTPIAGRATGQSVPETTGGLFATDDCNPGGDAGGDAGH